MNFVIFENAKGNSSFAWESELDNLPADTIAFTYYQQDNVDESGIAQSHVYIIGVPVEFFIGDFYIELNDSFDLADVDPEDLYCRFYSDNKREKFTPINKNTTVVNNFSELEEIFETIIKKEQVKKR